MRGRATKGVPEHTDPPPTSILAALLMASLNFGDGGEELNPRFANGLLGAKHDRWIRLFGGHPVQ